MLYMNESLDNIAVIPIYSRNLYYMIFLSFLVNFEY
jgi:hypothetical protein